jgi:hypothetical protein
LNRLPPGPRGSTSALGRFVYCVPVPMRIAKKVL